MNAASYRSCMRMAAWIAAVGSLQACGKPHDAGAAANSEPNVSVEIVATRRIRDVIELDGSVSPMQQVNLVARVSGTLEAIKFKDGDRVRSGQVLFVIEQPPYMEQLKLNKAKLEQCEADYKRQSELLKENANSQANVETSLSNMKQAQANVDIAQINLNYTVVKAPFDGIIGRRQVDAGNYVGATQGGTILATLMQVSPAYVYAAVGEREAIRIREKVGPDAPVKAVGHAVVRARLQGDTGPGDVGVLDFIDHQVNSSSGTVQVRGRFENRDYHLLPGFYAKLSIEAGAERDAVVLPLEVVQSDQEGDYVFVVGADSRAHRRNLKSRRLAGEEQEILGGLAVGEHVVIRGADRLADGTRVKIAAAGSN